MKPSLYFTSEIFKASRAIRQSGSFSSDFLQFGGQLGSMGSNVYNIKSHISLSRFKQLVSILEMFKKSKKEQRKSLQRMSKIRKFSIILGNAEGRVI